jgi:CheY-like chemotaxis protein
MGPTVYAGGFKSPRGGYVLVVEDNLVNLRLTQLLLEKAGFTVTTATSGPDALDAFLEVAFDLVLMDVQMPGMDGLETTAAIRRISEAGAKVPVVALTAYAMQRDRERFTAAGTDYYIAKPVDREELFRVVERCMNSIVRKDEVQPPSGSGDAVPAAPQIDVHKALAVLPASLVERREDPL